ncbi:MAG: ABC transporter substrate-binding protein [Sphaerochaetaceae bacterium]|jgi:oligogalacturonide transport system substrate-binding protein|nr:ABC transporter substrate-binding protein [Bacteroidales bacterium]
MKKIMVVCCVLVLLLGTVGANGAKEAETTTDSTAFDSNEKEELRFSWWGGDSRHKATLEAIDAFMKKYPNITVKAEYGAWDGWTEKCAIQLSGGTAPDVMQINWNWMYQFSADGSKFADLRNYADILHLENYDQATLDQGMVAGKMQSLPVGMTGKVFWWNKTTFDKAGLSVPSSFAEIMTAGKVFKEKLGDDYYPMSLYEYERMLLMLYYLESKYGKPWAANNQVNYSVAEVKEGLDWINSLETGHVLPSIAQMKGDGATVVEKNPKWITGKYAGFYEWDSAQAKMANALGENQEFVMGQFPPDLGSYKAALTKVTQCFAITENSKHKAAAAKLIEFLTSDPEGVKICSTERGMLANKAAVKTLKDLGMLKGLTFEGNQLVSNYGGFSLDPNFENSELKDSTGVYYEVFERLSNGEDSGKLASYLVDSINSVYASNPY